MGASLARTGSGGGGILEVAQGRLLQALAEDRVHLGVREAEPVVRQTEQHRGGPALELPPQRLVRHELSDHDLEISMGHRRPPPAVSVPRTVPPGRRGPKPFIRLRLTAQGTLVLGCAEMYTWPDPLSRIGGG